MKRILSLLLSIAFIVLSSSSVSAGLVTIDESGEVVWKVLAEEDYLSLEVPQSSSLEVKEAGSVELEEKSTVSLLRSDGKVNLLVKSGNTEKTLDVEGWKEDVVEVEERPQTQKLSISIEGDKFAIKQKGIKAVTSFPIKIDSESARVLLTTSAGDIFLAVMPYRAVETIFKSKLLNTITDNRIELTERQRELQYIVKGEKNINIANVYVYALPVEMRISALTGELIAVDSPSWFKYLGFLFS